MEPRANAFEISNTEFSARHPETNQAAICAACPVRIGGGFCAYIDATTLSVMASRSHRVALDRHAEVEPTGLSIVVEGALSEVHVNHHGTRRILGVTFPGEPVPPLEDLDEFANEAATPVVLCRISTVNYRRAMSQSHLVRKRICLQARAGQDRARYRAITLATLSPEERMAGFILESTRFMPWQPLPQGGGVLTMVFDRKDIAALLATSAETICRVLRRMQDCGYLRLRDASNYEIDDLDRLRSIARLFCPDDLSTLAALTARSVGAGPMIAVNAQGAGES